MPNATANPKPGANHPCVNIERVRAQFTEALAERQAEFTDAVGEVRTETAVLKSQVEDLRCAVADIPHETAALLDREREERQLRLKRGEGYFDSILGRLTKIEKQVLAVWILVGLIGLGKTLMWLLPLLGFGGIPQ